MPTNTGRPPYPTVTPEWSDLRPRDQRSFLLLIAEPDDKECSAWHGQMQAGYPVWERMDHEAKTRIRSHARRLLAQSHEVQLSDLDEVVATCGNAGCMTWAHLDVARKQSQRITEKEKQVALDKASDRIPQCAVHSNPRFRTCFTRQKSGNVTAHYRCINCEMQKKHEKNRIGRKFKAARRDF